MDEIAEATAGGAAGVVSLACMYPLVVVKTRLQAQRKLKKGAAADACASAEGGNAEYAGAVDCLFKVAKQEGLLGLFKGLSSSLPKAFVTNFMFYFFYAYLKPLFRAVSQRTGQFLGNMLHGICAGAAVQLVLSPAELINTRVIADRSGKARFMQSFSSVLREEGLAGLYRGLVPQLVLTLNPGITNVVRHWLTPSGAEASNSKNFWTGAASKACASIATYPYVLAKVQIFTFEKGSGAADAGDAEEAAELTVPGVLSRVLREEGLLGMYKGCELQLGTAVAKEALLNSARYPIRRFVMGLFGLETS